MAGKPLRKIIRSKPAVDPAEREEDLKMLDDILFDLDTNRASAKTIDKNVKSLQTEALKIMEKHKITERIFKMGDRKRRAQREQQSPAQIVDWDRVWKKLGPGIKEQCMTKVFDQNKFNAMVAAEEIDMKIIAECTSDGPPKTPFIKHYDEN